MEEQKKNVYILGNDISDIKHIKILQKFGINVITNETYDEFLDIFKRKKIINDIFNNVKQSDMVIIAQCYNKTNEDSLVAIGYALALNKEVWVVGNKNVESTFYCDTNVINFNSWFEVYSELHPLD